MEPAERARGAVTPPLSLASPYEHITSLSFSPFFSCSYERLEELSGTEEKDRRWGIRYLMAGEVNIAFKARQE